MGSSISSNCESIDEFVESKIYFPPETADEYFKELTTEISELKLIKIGTSEDIIPLVKVMPKVNTPDKYVIFSHGNGSDIYTMFTYFKNLADSLNVCVIGYDYIGYGLSKHWQPSEKGCYKSIDTVMDFVISTLNIQKEKIYLIGQSLGTGITIDYVSRNEWTNPIILISPYKSICRVAMDSSILSSIDKFKSLDKICNVKCPTKIFHGKSDQLINISHAMELYESLPNKMFLPTWYDNIGHNDILNHIQYHEYREILQL